MKHNLQARLMTWAYRGLKQLAAMTLLVFLVAGCNRGPEMAQVKGKVFYKDGTVPRGGVCVVRLEPAEGSSAVVRKGASSEIRSDGTFEMWTRKQGDGVYLGEYAVTFAVLKAPMDPVPLIQPQYMRAASSPYKITVDGDKLEERYEIEPLPGVKGAAAAPSQGS